LFHPRLKFRDKTQAVALKFHFSYVTRGFSPTWMQSNRRRAENVAPGRNERVPGCFQDNARATARHEAD
jgi:hypothetical protein